MRRLAVVMHLNSSRTGCDRRRTERDTPRLILVAPQLGAPGGLRLMAHQGNRKPGIIELAGGEIDGVEKDSHGQGHAHWPSAWLMPSVHSSKLLRIGFSLVAAGRASGYKTARRTTCAQPICCTT